MGSLGVPMQPREHNSSAELVGAGAGIWRGTQGYHILWLLCSMTGIRQHLLIECCGSHGLLNAVSAFYLIFLGCILQPSSLVAVEAIDCAGHVA